MSETEEQTTTTATVDENGETTATVENGDTTVSTETCLPGDTACQEA